MGYNQEDGAEVGDGNVVERRGDAKETSRLELNSM